MHFNMYTSMIYMFLLRAFIYLNLYFIYIVYILEFNTKNYFYIYKINASQIL